MSEVALFFFYRTFGGGTTSFTVHLFEAMRRAGHAPKIYRVKERGEDRERSFSGYEGVTYRNITSDEALRIVKKTPSLMTAPCNSKFLQFDPTIIGKMMKAGMRIVVHDPNELEIYDHLNNREQVQRPICIRPTMRQFFKDAHYIPHPYVREFDGDQGRPRPWLAVSVARVTFVKRTEIILEANRLLPKRSRIVLRGAENRLYTKFKILPRFPEYVQGCTGFPMTWGASARECLRAKYAVDMTWFPSDGGGSQYSFMESWDAGAVNVLHSDWLRYRGEMIDGGNCLAIDSAKDLARLLKNDRGQNVGDLVQAGYAALRTHDPVKVAQAYMRELTR
jgi:hypothetical protein